MASEPDASHRRGPAPFEQLDYLYTPSADVAADRDYLVDILGGRLVFAIDSMGTRVAAVELTEGPPLVLLADHLEGERPILVYRVPNLGAALRLLEARGWTPERTFEIPPGPCCSFGGAGGHRFALYERARPRVLEQFEGRRDF